MMRRGVSSNISWILFCTSSMSTATDRRGNRVLITISLINLLVLYPGTKLYYKWRNNQRDKVWNRMSPEVSGIVHQFRRGVSKTSFRRNLITWRPRKMSGTVDWTSDLRTNTKPELKVDDLWVRMKQMFLQITLNNNTFI